MTTLSTASSRIWISADDPTSAEENIDQGSFWLNTTTGRVFQNLDPTAESQIWSPMAAGSLTEYPTYTVDATTTSTATFGPFVGTGSQTFVVERMFVRLASATGLVTPPSVSLGQNATSYDDIISSTLLTGLSTAGDYFILTPSGAVPSIPSSGTLTFNVQVGAVASTYAVDVLVVGYYF